MLARPQVQYHESITFSLKSFTYMKSGTHEGPLLICSSHLTAILPIGMLIYCISTDITYLFTLRSFLKDCTLLRQ